MGTLTCPVIFDGNLLTNCSIEKRASDPSDAESFVGMMYREISTKKIRVKLSNRWVYMDGQRNNNFGGPNACKTSGHYTTVDTQFRYTLPPATGTGGRVQVTIRRKELIGYGDWEYYATNVGGQGSLTPLYHGSWMEIIDLDTPQSEALPANLHSGNEYEARLIVRKENGPDLLVKVETVANPGVSVFDGTFTQSPNIDSQHYVDIPKLPIGPVYKIFIGNTDSSGSTILLRRVSAVNYPNGGAPVMSWMLARGLGQADGTITSADGDTLNNEPLREYSTSIDTPTRCFTLVDLAPGKWVTTDRGSIYGNVNNTAPNDKPPTEAMKEFIDGMTKAPAYLARATKVGFPTVGEDRMFYLARDTNILYTWRDDITAYEIVSPQAVDGEVVIPFATRADNTETVGEVGKIYSYEDVGMIEIWDADLGEYRSFDKPIHKVLWHQPNIYPTLKTLIRKEDLVVDSLVAPVEMTFSERSQLYDRTVINWGLFAFSVPYGSSYLLSLDISITRAADGSVESPGAIHFQFQGNTRDLSELSGTVLLPGDKIEFIHRNIKAEWTTKIGFVFDICAEIDPGFYEAGKYYRLQLPS